ncbi:uncharacterized protein LOC143240932 isoform X1 [Tachypleus tridentatus]|uniref:uncharacterized protein LOC143240932 isoform X1 n=1 Tax=Tachypleus tridentatus TaxID=6853 RepID=UPI003FCF1026
MVFNIVKIRNKNLIVNFLFCLCFLNGIESLSITSLSVPQVVENGTKEYVDLDCVYNFTEEDDQLVVKWYYNDDPNPIYQWIPELNSRRVSEKFQDRVDMNFTVSPTGKFTKYRGLRILNPTTEFSGKYSCHVVSLNGIDDAAKNMIVYAPGKLTKFNYTKTSPEVATFTCEVDQIYPQPQVTLFQLSPEERKPKPLENSPTKIEMNNGSYRILVTREIKDSDLPSDGATTFECVILIPQINHHEHRSIKYFPGKQAGHSEELGSLGNRRAAAVDASPGGAPKLCQTWNFLLICSACLIMKNYS